MRYTLIALALAFHAPSAQHPAMNIGGLGWLAGCWEGNYANGRTVSEQWMKPLGNVMMGMSRTVKNGKAVASETIRLEQAEDGSIRYIANPSGQRETAFLLVELTAARAVFENPAHDYPQRIIYELVTEDSIAARIEGMVNGELKGSGFPYRRVSCE